MICDACRTAGRQNRAWKVGGGSVFLDLARESHASCKGCDCQHKVGVDSLP